MPHALPLPDTFDATLRSMLATRSDERRWALLDHLARWPEEARSTAFELLRSRGVVRRCRGAEMLGALSEFQPDRVGESAGALVEALDRESDLDALSFIVFALARASSREGEVPPTMTAEWWVWPDWNAHHHPDRPIVWDLIAGDRLGRILGLVTDPDADRRRDLAIALAEFFELDRSVIDALVLLSRDPEVGPRDWATFALAVLLAGMDHAAENDPDVVEAILDRLDDPEGEIRAEAAYGLALRRHPRAFEAVERQLREDEMSLYVVDAAGELADPRLIPGIEYLRSWWRKAEDADTFERALAACRAGTAGEPPADEGATAAGMPSDPL